MREKPGTDDIFGVASCFVKSESEAINLMGQVAQDLADEQEADVTVTKPDGKVVVEAFPAPKTKAFSFGGSAEYNENSKMANYEKIFSHKDFKGNKND